MTAKITNNNDNNNNCDEFSSKVSPSGN